MKPTNTSGHCFCPIGYTVNIPLFVNYWTSIEFEEHSIKQIGGTNQWSQLLLANRRQTGMGVYVCLTHHHLATYLLLCLEILVCVCGMCSLWLISQHVIPYIWSFKYLNRTSHLRATKHSPLCTCLFIYKSCLTLDDWFKKYLGLMTSLWNYFWFFNPSSDAWEVIAPRLICWGGGDLTWIMTLNSMFSWYKNTEPSRHLKWDEILIKVSKMCWVTKAIIPAVQYHKSYWE